MPMVWRNDCLHRKTRMDTMTKPPNTPQTAPEEELNIDVKSCQRCGEDHNITFLRLLNPADEFAWWGTCYKTGQPVLLTQNPRPLLPEGEIIVKGTICERHNRRLTLACRKCNTEAVEAARLPEGGEGKLKELIGSLATRLIDLGIDSKEHTQSRKIESVWIGFDALRDFLLSLPSPGEGVGDRPKIVCLCGSTRFWREFQRASLRETMAGIIVLSIGAASG